MGGGGGSSQGGDAVVHITNGGNVTTNRLTVAQDSGSDATLTISGSTSTVNVILNNAGSLGITTVGALRDGSATPADGTVILNDGTLSTRHLFVGGEPSENVLGQIDGGNGTVNVNNGARVLVLDRFAMAPITKGQATLNVSGGFVSVGGNASLSTAPLTNSLVSVNSGTWTVAGQLMVGESDTQGGPAIVNIFNNGLASANGQTSIQQTGTVSVGTGSSPGILVAGAGGMIVSGRHRHAGGRRKRAPLIVGPRCRWQSHQQENPRRRRVHAQLLGRDRSR
jgi:hypothetical protein